MSNEIDITFSDATKLAELIRTKQVSPVEVVQAHLDRIAAVNPKIKAVSANVRDAEANYAMRSTARGLAY